MERVVVNRSFTLYKTFYEGGVATDPDSAPTVTVTRADGTAVTAGAVTDETAAGTWSVTVPASANGLLDTLTVDWAALVNGESQEYIDTVEVAGGTLFTLAEFRALGSAYANTTNYPDSKVVDARTEAEQELEGACGIPFVPRYARETISGEGATVLRIGAWFGGRLHDGTPVHSVLRSATVDGTALTVGDVTLDGGGLYYPGGWTRGYRNITVVYEYGAAYVPNPVKRAGLLLAKQKLTPGAADDRAINMSNDTGTYALMQAGVRGHQFSIPFVQAVADAYDMRVGVA
jgi:hypothetical protein